MSILSAIMIVVGMILLPILMGQFIRVGMGGDDE